MRYFGRKVIFYLAAFAAAITLNFLIPRMLPGSPVDMMVAKLGTKGPVSAETRKSLEQLLGQDQDQSILEQFWGYLQQVFTGDLGPSVTYFPTPVTALIGQALPWTILLVGSATILSFVIGISIGIAAGWKRGSWIDNMIPGAMMIQTIPYFWLALILIYVFASSLGWFPPFGGYNIYATSPSFDIGFISSALYYGALPAATIVISSFGGWLIGMRNMMVSTLAEDYIVTAEAKGLSPRRILSRYATPNAILPSFTGFAVSLGFVVSGSLVMEQVFAYPGIGSLLLQATQNNDYALMQGVFLVITLTVLGANLVVDVLYGFIDPRTRARA